MCCEAYKRRLAYSVTVRNKEFQIYASFITKVLEYKARMMRCYVFLCDGPLLT